MPSLILPDASQKPAGNAAWAEPSQVRLFSWRDAVVLVGSALYLLLVFPHPWLTTDSGYIAEGADRIVRGQVPFRDFFTELGPGTYYLQAGFFKWLGVGLPAVNVLVWLNALGISWLIYRLGRLVIAGGLAVLPSFFFMAVCFPINSGLSHHWTGSFFFLLILLCLAESVNRAGSWNKHVDDGLWLVAGVLSVATLLCIQPKGFAAFLLAAAYVPVAEKACGGRSWAGAFRSAWRRSLCLVLGAAGAFTAAALFLARDHAAYDWLYDNFLFLGTNYWPYVNPSGSFWYALSHPVISLAARASLTNILFASGYYFFMAVGPATVLAGSVWCVRTLRDAENVRARLMLLYVLGSSAAFLSELHSLDLLHFVSGGILIATVLLSLYQIVLQRNPRAGRVLLAGAIAIGVFAVLGGAWQVRFTIKRSAPVATRRGTVYVTPNEAGPLREWIGVIQSRVPAEAETFIFPYQASFYFLTATRNPTRFDYLLPAFHTQSQYDEVAETLVRRRPQQIFSFGGGDLPPGSAEIFPDRLEIFLRSPQSPYRLEQEVGSMKIWALQK